MFWGGGGGGVNEQRLKVRSINISPPNPRRENSKYIQFEQRDVGGGEGAHTEQYYMERKNKIFVQKYVKIKLIRGKGQKTYECSQKEWLESYVLENVHPQHIALLRTHKRIVHIYENVR